MQQDEEEDKSNGNDTRDDEDDEGQMDDDITELSPKGRFGRYNEELGRGAYKVVYKGLDNETGREIAWNVISLIRLLEDDRCRIKSEINLIKNLKHKNILHFISGW